MEFGNWRQIMETDNEKGKWKLEITEWGTKMEIKNRKLEIGKLKL